MRCSARERRHRICGNRFSEQVIRTGPTREKVRMFTAQTITSVSSKTCQRKYLAQKEWKDASVLVNQYHHVVVTVLEHLEWSPDKRDEVA